MEEVANQRRLWFSLRTLLAMMAGCSFVAFVTQWLISQSRGVMSYPMVTSWALGSFAGLYLAARSNRSTLLGAICGGMLGNLVFPGTIIIFLYVNGMNGVNSLSALWMQIAFAVCGSGLLAAIVGIIREGISLRR